MVYRDSWRKWEKNGDPHLINRIQWDNSERDEINKVFNSDWFGYGEHQKHLEEKLQEYTGLKHALLTNSGSAALDVSVGALREEERFKRGDLILHPVTTFMTSIGVAINQGAVPVFVETKENTYVIDPEQVERAIKKHPEISGAIIPHLLGNIPDMDRIKNALGERFLIEDCCDTMGGYYEGKHIGNLGDFAAFSFYGSHHMTTAGVGGAIMTNNKDSIERAKSLIYWGRDFNAGNDCLDRYTYSTMGSDSQISAIQAAFGLAQIKKLNGFVNSRKKQFEEMTKIFRNYDYFNIPESDSKSNPSWFSYPLTVKTSAPFNRRDFAEHLIDLNIEVRPIMSGNILRQPPYKNLEIVTLDNKFPIADNIEDNGLFIPCWGMPENQRENYYFLLKRFLDNL